MLTFARHVPSDFERIYVQRGRLECQDYFKANRKMVDAWLRACGKQRLIDERAAFVSKQRANGEWMTRSTRLVTHREVPKAAKPKPIRDRRKVHPTVARHAAQHLRIVRHGGMIVSPAGNGDWWVGSRRLSAAQMLDFARSRGFDDKVVIIVESETLQRSSGDGVKG